ncbi:MAG: N-formylglutamate amidohydrolase [Pseudomonadota bacterium]
MMDCAALPYDHLRPGEGAFLIVADHASNVVPRGLNQLGLAEDMLAAHIAYDIGTRALAHALSARLGCEAILSNVSRLVIDKNRRLDQGGLVPASSDGIPIPGNEALAQSVIASRIAQFYKPYHAQIARQVAARNTPFLLSLHSFTPHMNGHQRPWECGLLYNTDSRIAQRAIAYFHSLGLCVGDNEPYPGNVYNATMDAHAEAHGHPYLMLEIRNDLLSRPEQVDVWTRRIVRLLDRLTSSAG